MNESPSANSGRQGGSGAVLFFAGASPEFRLAAACCRRRSVNLSPSLHELTAGIRWNVFLSLLERHHIEGLAYLTLHSRTDVPENAREHLALVAQGNLLSNMRALGLQHQLAKAFEERHINFVVLKGTPLCLRAFGDLRARRSRDIDLLIHAEDLASAEQVLIAYGWARTGLGATVGSENAHGWIASRKHYEYVHEATALRLELHWRPFENASLSSEPLLATREWFEVSPGVTLPTLPRTEMLLNLCVHGARHAWFRMKWIADVAALLEQEQCDVTELLRAAAGRGLERPVQQALILCRELFHLELHGASKPGVAVNLLARIARDALLTEDISPPSQKSAFVPRNMMMSNVLLRSGIAYWAAEARLRLASPMDEAEFPLPPELRFAYPMLRVPFWIKRRFFSQKPPNLRQQP